SSHRVAGRGSTRREPTRRSTSEPTDNPSRHRSRRDAPTDGRATTESPDCSPRSVSTSEAGRALLRLGRRLLTARRGTLAPAPATVRAAAPPARELASPAPWRFTAQGPPRRRPARRKLPAPSPRRDRSSSLTGAARLVAAAVVEMLEVVLV